MDVIDEDFRRQYLKMFCRIFLNMQKPRTTANLTN